MADEDQDVKPLEILQSMIDIFAERLVGLRTQCSTSNELTQSEIRTLEVNTLEILLSNIPSNLLLLPESFSKYLFSTSSYSTMVCLYLGPSKLLQRCSTSRFHIRFLNFFASWWLSNREDSDWTPITYLVCDKSTLRLTYIHWESWVSCSWFRWSSMISLKFKVHHF